MDKKIFSIGYEIPGHSENYVDFSSGKSLMDADILLISPDSFEPDGHWIGFSSSDDGCYDIDASRVYKQNLSFLKKEIDDQLASGKSIFIFLTKKEQYSLASSVSTEKKQRLYSTSTYSNYDFLSFSIGILTSASGNHVEFTGNQIFKSFYNHFKENLTYQLYLENSAKGQIIFTGRDKSKVLGAVYKIGVGNLVVLPCLEYDRKKFVIPKKDRKGAEKEYWSKEAIQFGKNLVHSLLQIDSDLKKTGEKTPTPSWVSEDKTLRSNRETEILKAITEKEKSISSLRTEIENLNTGLKEEQVLKDLLFEQGKPLENAVIKALKILDFGASNYDDGELEIDQVIISPEGFRYIGECEGKNEKAIDIDKLRQLMESMSADFARDEVSEKAYGILFGNPQRLILPEQRNLDFTQKCKTGAQREKIALIKTTDLFNVAVYLSENNDEDFKKKCREAIHSGLGAIVIFPSIPKLDGVA